MNELFFGLERDRLDKHEKFKIRFSDHDSFKKALGKSYDEYADECWPDFELFKKTVKFKREYAPRLHDKEVRRIRIKIKSFLDKDEPKINKIRKPRYDKEQSHYMGHENHPLRGRRELPLHPYMIENGIPIPNKTIHLGHGLSIKEKLVWPFHFMNVGDSILVPGISRNALMRASHNWSYTYKRNMVEEDPETGEWREIKRRFLVSEVYENSIFVGSRIWLVKKEYINA